MDRIQSTKNQRVKDWKKLLKTKGRKKTGAFLVEGFHLVEEAIKANASIEQIIVREDLLEVPFPLLKERTTIVSEEVAKELSDTETSQGIFAVIHKTSEVHVTEEIQAPFLFLDAVQDPGNVGTIIRSADAVGFQAVILGEETVDAYNPKTLRSAQGSHFHIDLIEQPLFESIEWFQNKGLPIYGTSLDKQALSYKEISPSDQFALIVGNEGAGVRPELLEKTTANLYIPIKGEAESLNVAIAASVLMFSLYG